jgi:isopropylmalate/homocitrate/citramalate synthase
MINAKDAARLAAEKKLTRDAERAEAEAVARRVRDAAAQCIHAAIEGGHSRASLIPMDVKAPDSKYHGATVGYVRPVDLDAIIEEFSTLGYTVARDHGDGRNMYLVFTW